MVLSHSEQPNKEKSWEQEKVQCFYTYCFDYDYFFVLIMLTLRMMYLAGSS